MLSLSSTETHVVAPCIVQSSLVEAISGVSTAVAHDRTGISQGYRLLSLALVGHVPGQLPWFYIIPVTLTVFQVTEIDVHLVCAGPEESTNILVLGRSRSVHRQVRNWVGFGRLCPCQCCQVCYCKFEQCQGRITRLTYC